MPALEQVFPDDVVVIFSNASDGSVAAASQQSPSLSHQQNAERFLQSNGLPSQRYRVLVRYSDSQSYTDVRRVDGDSLPGEVLSDALYTTLADRTITLPVADCVATVVYDPVTSMLGVLHLGRHSSVAGLIESFAIEVADNVGSDPRDWLVWMSPSLRQASDRLDYFTPADSDEWRDYVQMNADGTVNIDVVGHNRSRFERAGVVADNIHVSPIDTFVDEDYFSHRAANQLGRPERQGRMMVAVRRIAGPSNVQQAPL